VSEYLPDHRRIFNAGDYFDRATAFAAGFNVDVEYSVFAPIGQDVPVP